MGLSKQFETNANLEVNGVPVTVGDANPDGSFVTFILARAGKSNKNYQKALTRAAAPFSRQLRMNIEVPQLEEAYKAVFCDVVLRGWSNVPKADVTGNKEDSGYIEFNKQNAMALFNRLPELYEFLQEQASSASLFLEANREEDAKN